ncbi:MAG: DNA primase [Eubacteriales bacterium]|nr:DNA primase [Eubacteriales bacterium]
MYYSEDLIEEVRLRNDIVDVISGYVKLQRKGNSYFGLCPFHNEKSPSFSVSPDKQMYYCFGCGAGGNVFTFIMQYENYTFPEAMKFLADRAGIELPSQEMTAQTRQEQDLKTQILELNKQAANYFYYQLRTENGAHAMEYLSKRGITKETMKNFGLGFSTAYSDDLYRYFKKKGVSDELLKQSGLMNVDERRGMYDKFWNRVIFPIQDVNGRVIGFGGRVMGDGKPKYLNSPETIVFDKSRNLYGLNAARISRKKYFLLCEGYMDVIALHQAGFKNAVASLGTAFTSQHAGLLRRYTEEVVLTYDSDEAGKKAALRAIPILKAAGITAKVLHMDPYKDPDEFIKAEGGEKFQERIDQAENSFLFELSVMEQKYQMTDPESKTLFFREVAAKLIEFDQELERENYIEAVAVRYHVGFENLRKMVNQLAMKGYIPKIQLTGREKKLPEKEDGMKKSQRILLTWLIEYPKLFETVKKYISPEDFTEELYRTVAEMVYEQQRNGEINPAKIINHFEDSEQQMQVAQLFNTTVSVDTKEDLQKAVRETIAKVMENSISYQMNHSDPTDISGIQKMIENKRKMQELAKLTISLS